jgi:peptidoglycan/LPS O-acetylase OafA/YrhL
MPVATSSYDPPSQRVKGLDALRFVLAMWVVFGHVGLPPVDESERTVARAVYHNIISGPAAVIVFFVISGFCIHFPYRNGRSLDLLSFYARRHIRILVPVAVASMIAAPLGIKLALLSDSILWSLLCEEIYYTIYPFLRLLAARVGFGVLFSLTLVLSYVVAFTLPNDGNYPSYHWGLNWVLGLPCWLLGCMLAESCELARRSSIPTSRRIWYWRLTVWGLSVVCSVLRFHTQVTYPYTLNLFAIVAAVWLRYEIRVADAQGASWLEPAGRISYSIYLMHLQANAIWKWFRQEPHPTSTAVWIVQIAFILLVSGVFFLSVEWPAHALARKCQRWVLRATRRSKTELAHTVGAMALATE